MQNIINFNSIIIFKICQKARQRRYQATLTLSIPLTNGTVLYLLPTGSLWWGFCNYLVCIIQSNSVSASCVLGILALINDSSVGCFFFWSGVLIIWVHMHLEIEDIIVQNTFNGFIINASMKVSWITTVIGLTNGMRLDWHIL